MRQLRIPLLDDCVSVLDVRLGHTKLRDGLTEWPRSLHPVVRTHPVTGRKALFISPVYTVGIEGMAPNAADPLLAELYKHLVQDQFIYRHRWRPGMVVIWDNRCTMHNALGGYDGHRRVMHRTTVAGEAPV